MKKTFNISFLITLLALCCGNAAMAQSWDFAARAGYSIGGTLPFNMPAELRHINSFSPKFNFRLGIDAEYRINDTWGILTGLQFERKGFKGDMAAKQYNITMKQGGEEISGPFTGNVVVHIVQSGFTIPVQAAWHVSSDVTVRGGLYASIITGREFHGYAYGEKDKDGRYTAYLRQDSPQGPLVYIGNDEESRGTFEGEAYKDYMRRFQMGADIGADWYLSKRWGAFCDVSLGFNSAFNDKEGNPVNMSLYPLYGTLGVIYKIGK